MSDDHQVKKRKLSPECDECQARKQKLASVSEEKPEVLTPGTPTSETSTSETSTSKASTPETVASDASTSATSASEPDEHQAKKRKLTSGSDSAPETPLRIRRHSKKARVPTRGSPQAAGYDLYSAEQKIIPARGKAVIDTQISIAVPEGTYGRVAPRSGLAAKFGIDTGAGVIDADYRGILYILLFNLGVDDFEVNVGDRVAQLVLERICTPGVSEVDELDETIRGNGRFGSTGGHKAL